MNQWKSIVGILDACAEFTRRLNQLNLKHYVLICQAAAPAAVVYPSPLKRYVFDHCHTLPKKNPFLLKTINMSAITNAREAL